MKLQHNISRRYKGKKYSTYQIVLPDQFVRDIGWDKGIELDVNILDFRNNSAILKPKNKTKRMLL